MANEVRGNPAYLQHEPIGADPACHSTTHFPVAAATDAGLGCLLLVAAFPGSINRLVRAFGYSGPISTPKTDSGSWRTTQGVSVGVAHLMLKFWRRLRRGVGLPLPIAGAIGWVLPLIPGMPLLVLGAAVLGK